MQGVVWSSFSRELNSILQVRTGCGQAPPVTLMVVPEPALISCRRWWSSGTFIPDTNPEQNIPHGHKSASNHFFFVLLLHHFPFGSKRGSTLKLGHPRAVS